MPLACVYLRYHYVVDVLAGLALAGVMIAVTARFGARLAGPVDEVKA
jgi:membrane-associated phospholipid phosphatase